MSQFEAQKNKLIQHWQVVSLLLLAYDVITVIMSWFLALWARFDGHYSEIPLEYLEPYKKFILIHVVFTIAVYFVAKLYRSIWRFASYNELLRIVLATAVTGIFHCFFITFFLHRMPLSYYAGGMILQGFFCVLIRFSYRFILLLRGRRAQEGFTKRVMLIGAGNAGQTILRDIKNAAETNEKVMCIIDDNPNKKGRYIDGVQIYGDRTCIMEAAKKFGIDKIYVAIPSASVKDKRDILNICNETGCELKNLPGIYQLLDGEVAISKMKEVAIEDLLGRDQIQVDMTAIYNYIQGKTVLITGGGGSIGSELSRQVAAHNPKTLIIFDVYENNAYDIQQELKKKYPELDLKVLIGSVRDSRKMFQVFEQYRPQIVYHAAAHKHVPLMEDSPCEAIKNNAIGTYKTAYAALSHGCERFVLISTDKAVNPTNIMGASKRLCEMIIQAFDFMVKNGRALEIPQLFTHHELKDFNADEELRDALLNARTEFVAVRFGSQKCFNYK